MTHRFPILTLIVKVLGCQFLGLGITLLCGSRGEADLGDRLPGHRRGVSRGPEQIQTLELNTTVRRPRWMLSASLFQNQIDIARSIQLLDPRTGLYGSFSDDSGRWITRGMELILEARPLPDLNLSASLTGQRTEDRGNDIDPGYSPALLAKLKANWSLGPMIYSAYADYVDGMEADWDFVPGARPGVVERIGEPVPACWYLGLNLRWDPVGSGPYLSLHLANLLDAESRYLPMSLPISIGV